MDNEFPEPLNRELKQITLAKQLAGQHLGVGATEANGVAIQRCFSKTFEVSMQDERPVIIQFRIEHLDTKPFEIAHGLIGNHCPRIEAIEASLLAQQNVWAVYMTRIPGRTWLEQVDNWKDEQQVVCMSSLGTLLARTFVKGRTDEAVENTIRDLRRCQALGGEKIDPYRSLVAQLIEAASRLRALPLAYTHFDINEMIVLAMEEGEITGIIDWEMATPQPSGINCACSHYLAGEIVKRQWRMKNAYEEMERGFWTSLLQNTDAKNKELVESSLAAVQTSVTIGTFFKTFSFEGEKANVSEAGLKALPRLLKYKIPALRGSAPPYSGA